MLGLVLPQLNAQTANPVGSASDLGGDCFSITPDEQNQNGAVWYSEQLDLTQYFSLSVELNLGTNDWNGADGIMLVMQQVGLDALGLDGQGMGFSGFSPSLGVEFDTFTNTENSDPDTDHMAIHINGIVDHANPNSISGPVPILDGGVNAENGQDIEMRLVWNPEIQIVQVFTNCDLRLSATIDLQNDVFNGDPLVYWGFTGATGFYTNTHTVCFTEAAYLNPPQEFSICEGDEVELEILSDNPTNIAWSPAENISSTTSLNPTVTPVSDVTYTVTYEKCGETFTDDYIFNVSSLVLEPVSDQAICPGEMADFMAVTDPSYDILWSTDVSNVTQETFATPGTYWVEVTDGLCTKREEFELAINPLPVLTAPSTVEYCFLDSAQVTVSSAGADIYAPNGVQTSEFYISAEQEYLVTAVDQVTGCESTAMIQGVELPLPVIPFEEFYEICPYESLELALTDDYSVEWSTSSADNSETFNTEGDYGVTAELNGCTLESTFTLIVNPIPVSAVPGVYEFCEDDSLVVTNANPNYEVLWPSGENLESYVFNETGTYGITITDIASGCFTAESIEVEKKFNPVITLEDFYEVCVNEFIIIEPELEFASELIWSSGETASELKFSEPAAFSVSATNECTTTVENSFVEHIVCDCFAFLPLAFTPDGDGLNEVFLPKLGCDPVNYELVVYNKWGEQVFITLDEDSGWNGSFQNGTHYVPSGVYTYKLSYSSEQFDGLYTEIKYGTVSVIR